jgi:putative ABC transport system permease protein
MREILASFRWAARRLWRHPGFVVAAVSTLALGIGANTAIFSVLHGILLLPLPYPEPDRLVMIWETKPEPGWAQAAVSPADFLDWRQPGSPWGGLTAYSESLQSVNLSGLGEPRAVKAALVYGNFFSVFGVRPRLGRWLREEETWPGPRPVAVLSYSLWRGLGADPHLIGRSLSLDGRERTIVGVMPEHFQYPAADVDLWIPIRWQTGQLGAPLFRAGHSLRVVGRLRPQVSLVEARSYLAAVNGRLERQYPATNRDLHAGLIPLRDWLVGSTEPALLALFAAALLVLAIACINVANLQLSREIGRSQELAIRLALGAPRRGLLLGPPLAEGLLVGALGTLGGIGMAILGLRFLLLSAGRSLPRAEEISLNGKVLIFSLGCGVASGLLAGLVPALLSLRPDVSALRGGAAAKATISRGWRRAQSLLVVAEIALAVLLVTQAALLARSFAALVERDPGFRTAGVLTAKIHLPLARYQSPRAIASFWSRFLDSARALPGARQVALTNGLPLGGLQGTVDLYRESRPAAEHGEDLSHRVVSSDYFLTLGVPLLRGRFFPRGEGDPAPGVVLLNQAAARSYFPGEDPVGRRISFVPPVGPGTPWQTIVGVVADERVEGLAGTVRPEVFEPLAQAPPLFMNLVFLSRGGLAGLPAVLRANLRALDKTLALSEVQPLESIAVRALLPARSVALLASLFAALALFLAAVGIFGVTSFLMRQRIRELGIRIALGATRERVLVTALGRTLVLLGAGGGLGLLGGMALPVVLASLLFQVHRLDGWTAGAVLLLLLAVGLAASYFPASRAARTDPADTLRAE